MIPWRGSHWPFSGNSLGKVTRLTQIWEVRHYSYFLQTFTTRSYTGNLEKALLVPEAILTKWTISLAWGKIWGIWIETKYYCFVLTATIFLEAFSFNHNLPYTIFPRKKQKQKKISAHRLLLPARTPDWEICLSEA